MYMYIHIYILLHTLQTNNQNCSKAKTYPFLQNSTFSIKVAQNAEKCITVVLQLYYSCSCNTIVIHFVHFQ